MTDTVVWSLFIRQISRALMDTVGSSLPSYLLVSPHLPWLPCGNLCQRAASLPSNLEGMTSSLSVFLPFVSDHRTELPLSAYSGQTVSVHSHTGH